MLLGPAAAGQPGTGWREAPEFVRLFAPPSRASSYRAYVSTLDLAAVLRDMASDPSLIRPPGAWQARAVLAADAFGQGGTYDRWALARLYGARRPLFARGPRGNDGEVAEVWTLISPYPDAELHTTQPGTLLIVLQVP